MVLSLSLQDISDRLITRMKNLGDIDITEQGRVEVATLVGTDKVTLILRKFDRGYEIIASTLDGAINSYTITKDNIPSCCQQLINTYHELLSKRKIDAFTLIVERILQLGTLIHTDLDGFNLYDVNGDSVAMIDLTSVRVKQPDGSALELVYGHDSNGKMMREVIEGLLKLKTLKV